MATKPSIDVAARGVGLGLLLAAIVGRAAPGAAAARRPASSAALFLPRISVVVVAVALPEAELVVVEELQTADPLRALPEIALGDEQAERIAVLRLERLAVERVREQDVVVIEDGQRQVGGV